VIVIYSGTKSHTISSLNIIFMGCEMTYYNEIQQQKKNASTERPQVTSYDSGYEHSIEHLAEVKFLMEEAEEESGPAGQKRAMAAKA
jgi:hypothetical protein